jgi:hypothetical protein
VKYLLKLLIVKKAKSISLALIGSHKKFQRVIYHAKLYSTGTIGTVRLRTDLLKIRQCSVPVSTEKPAEPVPVPGGGVSVGVLPHLRPVGPGPVAVDADHKAALAARPVLVEERGLAHVAHLTHALHHALPRHCQVLG